MTILSRLKILRYRNVTPCELSFHSRWNVLLGENGSGKTTLLKLLASLYRDDVRAIAPDEEFDLEVEFQGEGWRAVTHLQNTLREISGPHGPRRDRGRRSLGVDIELQAAQGKVRYRNDPDTMQWSIAVGGAPPRPVLGLVGEPDPQFRFAVPSLIRDAARALNAKAIDAELQTGYPVRFDESTEFLGLLAQLEFQVTFRDGMIVASGFDGPVGPLSLESGILFDSQQGVDRLYLSAGGDQTAFLQEFCLLTGIREATFHGERKVRHSAAESSLGDLVTDVYSGFRFSFTRRDGSIFPQEHLSYGQKRLLGFLCYLDAVPQAVIADELVNGLHYRWIKRCVELMGTRQAFLTSQNPLLLDCLWFESQEQVRKSFLLCSSEEQVAGKNALTWRFLTDNEAEAFYRAYK